MTSSASADSEAERSRIFAARRDELQSKYLVSAADRPASSARGLHHMALISSDV
ncbi:MAG: VOC family protein, partial [Gordonia sp. (in: high G+C Gram-positive bacteria)]